MELALNLVWATLAIAGLVCYLRASDPSSASRATQVVALAMLLLILFPVISVTDDIWAAQNPAEADTCLRRNEVTAYQHTIVPDMAVPRPTQTGDFAWTMLSSSCVRESAVPAPQTPPRSTLFTRPPPLV